VSGHAPIIAVDAVSKSFPTGGGLITVMRDASLALRPGEITGIIGSSGSGKTTMLMIAGLLEAPDKGEVRFRGKRTSYPGVKVDRLRHVRRKHVGFVFQKANLIPFLNALENVAVALEIGGCTPAAAVRNAKELLSILGVEHRLTSMPSQLSGGEQQRVAIARAFANDAALLFADEPTAALDPSRAQQVMELFQTLAKSSNVAVCVFRHDLRWEHVTDTVAVFEDGKTFVRKGGAGRVPLELADKSRQH